MPQRFLKPGLRESPRFNQASWPAQSLFLRLITLVDDYARFDAHPLLLARVAFPYGTPTGKRITPEQVQAWLEELQRLDLLVLYEVRGAAYLQLRRWTERLRMKNPSRFPPVPTAVCQQMTADAVTCCQMLSNAALPTSTSASTTTSVPFGEKIGGFASPEAAMAAQTRQFAAAQATVKRLEAIPEEDRTAKQGEKLKKNRAVVLAIQRKQSAGDFTPLEVKHE
jgi:hypothetical protein